MSFTIHTIDAAPAASKDALTAVQKKYNFIPNLMAILAEAPSALGAYLSLADLLGKSSLTPKEQNVVLLTTSRLNGCDYCTAAHTWSGTGASLSQAEIDALREQHTVPDPKLEALRVFTAVVVADRGNISADDLHAFLKAGYTKQNVLEVILAVAMKTISNYTNHIADTPLDKELAPFAYSDATA